MRDRIEIQSYSITRNSAGEEVLSWSVLATVWAAIEYKGAGSDESEQQNQLTAMVNALVRIRYRSDLDTKMRVRFDSKYWNIRAMLPDAMKNYLLLECEHFET
jgi:SPP1 family predicted phage head-tail adaptor